MGKLAVGLPVDYYSVVEKLSETSCFEQKGHIQHDVAVSCGNKRGIIFKKCLKTFTITITL